MHLLHSVVHLSAQLSIHAPDIAGTLIALCDIQWVIINVFRLVQDSPSQAQRHFDLKRKGTKSQHNIPSVYRRRITQPFPLIGFPFYRCFVIKKAFGKLLPFISLRNGPFVSGDLSVRILPRDIVIQEINREWSPLWLDIISLIARTLPAEVIGSPVIRTAWLQWRRIPMLLLKTGLANSCY